ncbi:MAG: branched-chain amino acid transaminase [Deltaproteobacteria bacterium]|nr:branched-chain amino acid transaminase [Deltaproteobacteria bacterium]
MQKGSWIWMDGEFVPWDEAKVHVLTHTLHYGLGVFEGIRCYKQADGRSAVFRLDAHNRRLFDSARILGLEVPFAEDELARVCVETVRRNGFEECYLRPLVFLGDGEMGLAARNRVRVSVAVWPWGAYLGEEGASLGITVKTSSFHRFHSNTLMSKAKTVGNYVNSILASYEARNAGCEEALMLDTEGFVAEGSGENVFIIRSGVVKTPGAHSILPGITRDTVMTLLAEMGHAVREERVTRDEIYIADEAFFTGTAAEIAPIREIDHRRVGSGGPGPLTREVQARYQAVVRGRDERHRDWLTPV